MKNTMQTLEYKGKKYNLVFNLNVMEAIQDEYGKLDTWTELTSGEGEEVNAKAVIFGFTAMINEGIDIQNEEEGTEIKPLTLKQVGRILSEVGMDSATNAMKATVVDSVGASEEPKSKNEYSKTTKRVSRLTSVGFTLSAKQS